MVNPLDFITRLREIYPERYDDGANNCLKFHLLLKALYPRECHGWYDSNHIISQIHGEYYDIDGVAEKTANYLPIEEYSEASLQQFTQTDRHDEIFECAYCDLLYDYNDGDNICVTVPYSGVIL